MNADKLLFRKSGTQRWVHDATMMAFTVLLAGLVLACLAVESAASGLSNVAAAPGPGTPLRTTIYRIRVLDGEQTLAPYSISVPDDQPAIVYAVDAMAALPDSPLPSGTEARSLTLDDRQIATLDLNAAFVRNFHGGDEAEAMAIDALLRVTAQFPGITDLLITVDGKSVDSLGGHIDLSQPLEVTAHSPETPKRYEHRKERLEERPPKTIACATVDQCSCWKSM